MGDERRQISVNIDNKQYLWYTILSKLFSCKLTIQNNNKTLKYGSIVHSWIINWIMENVIDHVESIILRNVPMPLRCVCKENNVWFMYVSTIYRSYPKKKPLPYQHFVHKKDIENTVLMWGVDEVIPNNFVFTCDCFQILITWKYNSRNFANSY